MSERVTKSNSISLLSTTVDNGTGKRKGHRKSRGGCIPCKRRKKKCQETRPACFNCLRSRINCEYSGCSSASPTSPTTAATVGFGSLIPQPRRALPSTPLLFTPADMQAFHHFLLYGRPHLPLGSYQAWQEVVPKYAHEYDYLMHAILALGASHRRIGSPTLMDQGAIKRHQLLAVNGLNQAMSREQVSDMETDAMLATCYSLAFQARWGNEGLGDFLTLVRGCGSVTLQIKTSNRKSELVDVNGQTHEELMETRLLNAPWVNPMYAHQALESLEHVGALCTDEWEMKFLQALTGCASCLLTSTHDAYYAFMESYGVINRMPHPSFAKLVAPGSKCGAVLIGHFIAMEILLSPCLVVETAHKAFSEKPYREPVARAVIDLVAGTDELVRRHLRWPLELCSYYAENDIHGLLLPMPMQVAGADLGDVALWSNSQVLSPTSASTQSGTVMVNGFDQHLLSA